MPEDLSFQELIRRVRRGDQGAAAELLRQYEPEIRRIVRVRLTDPGIRRVVDSMDVCQSVMGNFFVRCAHGQFDLHEPQQLLKLLVRMTQNKVLDHVRRQQADRRDRRREQGTPSEALSDLPGREASPSFIVAGRDLLQAVRSRLTDEERYLAEQRDLGRDWAELAAELGKGAEALRKQLARAIDRVAHELGLDDDAPPS
jgi:RNA polymerase sigma factor (sigma-70 family)